MTVLQFEHVYLQRGSFLLKDVSFQVEEGASAALMGRSGAGKTTLIHLMGNAVCADAGRITYFGKELYENEKEIRRNMSVMYDVPNFNTELRAKRLATEIRRFEPWFDMEFFVQNMDEMGMSLHKRVKHFSKGAQKKYMLLLALCRQPRLLVMDEPTSGLDEQSRMELWKMIQEYKQNTPLTVVFSTHNPMDVEQMQAQTIWIENGGLV